MFTDIAEIKVCAGRGGDGSVSFHREKYVPAGGPDGGDGGRGGDIILKADERMSTLMDFRYKRKYEAENGRLGGTKKCFGKTGKPLVIRVPRGTVVREKESGAVMADMGETDEFVLAHGGRGGWGNTHFATPTRQTPRFSKPGLPGESFTVILELKLLADVGLIGFPNVGKSTLLSVISAARPKIANYHFTTLSPNLGIVSVGDKSFTVADIPGIIEGAAGGAGLGLDFLRHIDRCRLLIHLVDVSGFEGRVPSEDYEHINSELFLYSEELAARPQIVAANKCDILENRDGLEKLKKRCAKEDVPVFEISAATKMGVEELMNAVASALSKLPPIKTFEPNYVPPLTSEADRKVKITVNDSGIYVVEGEHILSLIANVNPNDYESLNYMQRILKSAGVFTRLEEMGINEGDIVSIYNFEFEYVK